MRRKNFINRKLMALSAIVATLLVQIVSTSVATTSPPALTDVDLSAEIRTLDTFLNDLVSYDRRGKELSRKPALTRAELVAYEQTATDLKRRLFGVQNALRQVITKFKAAGLYERLNETALERVTDPDLQAFARREDFKRLLEDAASNLSNETNQISAPVEALRSKVQAQMQDRLNDRGESDLARRAIRVAYTPTPAVLALNLMCRMAYLRAYVTKAFSRDLLPSERSNNAYQCYCQGNGAACSEL